MKPNEIIKKYRKKLGLTQEELAKSLFIATNTYNQYETGKRSIDADMFLSVLKTLNIDMFFEDLYNFKYDTLVVDIFLSLRKKDELKNIHSFPLINISYLLEELIYENEIDARWIDHILVEIDSKSIFFISIDNFTVDFDSKGRKIGTGQYTRKTPPPWEKKIIRKTKEQKNQIPFDIKKIDINHPSTKHTYRHNHMYIQFEMKEVGFYLIDIFYLFKNGEYTWKFGDTYHDFPKNKADFSCPFCSDSYDGKIPSTECPSASPYSEEIFSILEQYLPKDVLNIENFKN